jgi:hypothetical protein
LGISPFLVFLEAERLLLLVAVHEVRRPEGRFLLVVQTLLGLCFTWFCYVVVYLLGVVEVSHGVQRVKVLRCEHSADQAVDVLVR